MTKFFAFLLIANLLLALLGGYTFAAILCGAGLVFWTSTELWLRNI